MKELVGKVRLIAPKTQETLLNLHYHPDRGEYGAYSVSGAGLIDWVTAPISSQVGTRIANRDYSTIYELVENNDRYDLDEELE